MIALAMPANMGQHVSMASPRTPANVLVVLPANIVKSVRVFRFADSTIFSSLQISTIVESIRAWTTALASILFTIIVANVYRASLVGRANTTYANATTPFAATSAHAI